MKSPNDSKFNRYYEQHCKHLKLNGLRPKTIEAHDRGTRRIGACFNGRIDDLSHNELPNP